jgi:hypothetical protein
MPKTLSGKIDIGAVMQLVETLDLANRQSPLGYKKVVSLSSGVGADQADLLFHDRRTLAASGTENLDLAGGTLMDPLQAGLTFARLRAVIVAAASANANNVLVASDGVAGVPLFIALGDGVAVRPGGIFCFVARDAVGVLVTPATGDLLTITNGGAGTPVTYDVVLVGCSA